MTAPTATPAPTTPRQPSPRLQAGAVGAVLVAAAVAAAVGPFPVTAGVARLAGWVLLVTGASVLVARTGTVDLSLAATAAIGAYVGAVALPLIGAPALFGLLAGTAAGSLSGALAGALAGRVGGRLAALPTLSIGLAVVAVVRAWPGSGGAAGYHAAPFLTGGETTDAVATVLLVAVALAAATAWWPTRGAARASVGARSPAALAALGHRPAVATAAAGALGGAMLGAGGATQAMVSGSVTPAAFGLPLAAALALAAALGGAPPVGPLVGALWLWGPAVVVPLAPVIGDAPPLLTTGVLGLVLLAARRGRSLAGPGPVPAAARPLAAPGPAPDAARSPSDAEDMPAVRARPTAPPERRPAPSSRCRPPPATTRWWSALARSSPSSAPTAPASRRCSPASAGSCPTPSARASTGPSAPRGAVARARAGVARAWQRPPDAPPADLLAAAVHRDQEGPATAELAHLVGACLPHDPTRSPAAAQLVAAARARPAVVLLDEPATTLPEQVVADVVVTLADAGVAVVLVDHRPAVLAVADRRCAVTSTSTAPPTVRRPAPGRCAMTAPSSAPAAGGPPSGPGRPGARRGRRGRPARRRRRRAGRRHRAGTRPRRRTSSWTDAVCEAAAWRGGSAGGWPSWPAPRSHPT